MNKFRNEKKELVGNSFSTSSENGKSEIRQSAGSISRRSFLHTGLAAGAGTAAVGVLTSRAEGRRGRLTRGDEAILRFLSAAEIIETDAWQQYNELCGVQDSEVPGGSGNILFTDA